MSRDRQHIAEIGRKGGEESHGGNRGGAGRSDREKEKKAAADFGELMYIFSRYNEG